MAESILIGWDKIHYMFDKDLPPAARIRSGASVTLQTERADCMLLGAERPVFRDRNEVIEANPNPVTGPIYVEGAEPGDFVRVSIKRVVPCPDGSLSSDSKVKSVISSALFSSRPAMFESHPGRETVSSINESDDV